MVDGRNGNEDEVLGSEPCSDNISRIEVVDVGLGYFSIIIIF